MECYSIRQYCQERGETNKKKRLISQKQWDELSPCPVGFKAKLDWFNETVGSSTPPLIPAAKDEMDSITFLDLSSRQLPSGGRAVLWHPCCPLGAGPRGGTVLLPPGLRATGEPRASTHRRHSLEFHQLEQMDSLRHGPLPPIIMHTNIKLTNPPGRPGLFVSIPMSHPPSPSNTCPCKGWAFFRSTRKRQQRRIPFSRLLPLFCYSKVPEIETQTPFDSSITPFQAAPLLALALRYLEKPKPQNVLGSKTQHCQYQVKNQLSARGYTSGNTHMPNPR